MAHAAGAARAAAAAAIARATKASGAFANMEPDGFPAIVHKREKPLVVIATGWFLSRSFRHLVGYKGFVFHTNLRNEFVLPGKADVVHARTVWAPG